MRLGKGSEFTVYFRLTTSKPLISTDFTSCKYKAWDTFLDLLHSPFVAGTLIDSTCQFWKVDHCTGDRMNCQLFEPISYRQGFGLVMLVPGLLACAGFMWISNILTKNSFQKQNHDKLLSWAVQGLELPRTLKQFRPRVLLFISRNFGCAHFCDIRVCSKMKLIQAVSVYFWVFVVCKQNGESILRYSFFVRAKLRSLMFVPCIGAIYNFFHVFSWNCSVERELYPSELTVDERLNVPSTVDASAVVTLKMNCFSTVSIFVATFGLVDGSYSFVRHFS